MDRIKELLQKVMGLAFEVNSTTKHSIFVNFSGHVNDFSIDIYINGWQEEEPIDSANIRRISFYLDRYDDPVKELKEAIKILESLKGED